MRESDLLTYLFLNKWQRELINYFTINMITNKRFKDVSFSRKYTSSDNPDNMGTDDKAKFIKKGLAYVLSHQDISKVNRKILKALVNEDDPNYKDYNALIQKIKKKHEIIPDEESDPSPFACIS